MHAKTQRGTEHKTAPSQRETFPKNSQHPPKDHQQRPNNASLAAPGSINQRPERAGSGQRGADSSILRVVGRVLGAKARHC